MGEKSSGGRILFRRGVEGGCGSRSRRCSALEQDGLVCSNRFGDIFHLAILAFLGFVVLLHVLRVRFPIWFPITFDFYQYPGEFLKLMTSREDFRIW